MDNKITAIDDNNNKIEFIVIDSLIVNDNIYIVATENEDDTEIEATILKEIKIEGDYITYSFIEDEIEFDEVMEVLNQKDDYDFI